ncbi:unnamed protein product [Parascedosporium putredinis]|uniref:Glycoside hydrolase family 3 C-terminal domain-containing protein n=1 Tax=Parascedosporium putredinis TaxID=1442378 RepID=A0A9P1HB67_9PEZI|nr:unnamed protein product [Parascedosporium putredinis]CAI8001836.1 unnamed protein product [Parascedosporium putredinis]
MAPLKSLAPWALSLALAAGPGLAQPMFEFPDCENGPLADNLVCDVTASHADRAAALVEAMTIDEKLRKPRRTSSRPPRLRVVERGPTRRRILPGVDFQDKGEFAAATSFANPILLSAAFDDDLVREIATVISTEARAFSNAGHAGLDYWTPNDPRRIKGYVKALLSGLEGDDPSKKKIIATCKHYAGNDIERWGDVVRHNFSAPISLQDLTVLRDHWGWDDENQYVTSDCNAVGDFYTEHHWVETAAEAAAEAYAAGTDTVCEVGLLTDVVGAWNQSLLTEETIDRALTRLYHGLVRVGYFDPADSSDYRSLTWDDVNTEHAQKLALQSAVDGIVLLKNDGTLPLDYDAATPIAVIGHWGRAPSRCSEDTQAPRRTTPRPSPGRPQAAENAELVYFFGGLHLNIEREDRDRTSIAWPAAQLALLEKVCALGKPCVVIQLGDQIDDAPLLNNANVSAILWAGYPGQAGGTAVFDLLYGISAPAGRLPVTQYPASYAVDVPMTDMTLRPSDISPGRTYKWYADAVLPFGHGLHYTTFEASFASELSATYDIQDLLETCEERYLDLCAFDTVSVAVENTGDVLSDFVALVFVNGTYGPSPYPLKELVGYHRFRDVDGGESQEADIHLTLGDIARVDINGNAIVYPGVTLCR